MTIQEWAEHWLENDVRPKVRPTTYAAKRYIVQNHIVLKLGEIPLDCLTEKMVGTFLDERKRCGSSRPESTGYPGLSDVTMPKRKPEQDDAFRAKLAEILQVI